MIKLLGFVAGLVGVFWMALAGGYAVYRYDRAEPGWPNLHLRVAFVHWTFHLPDSLGAKLAKLETAEAAALAHTRAVEAHDAQIGAEAAQHDQTAQAAIQVRYRTLIKEIPGAITLQTDTRYPLPIGFVRLHDAAALGVELSTIRDSAQRPDDAASDVRASDAASVIASNYGRCAANAQSLTDLQGWVRDEGVAAR